MSKPPTVSLLCALLVVLVARSLAAAPLSPESIFEKKVLMATWETEDQELTDAMTTLLSKGFGSRIFEFVSLQVVANDFYVGKTYAYLTGCIRLRNKPCRRRARAGAAAPR